MHSTELKRIAFDNGFQKKKKSYFRIHGDNILQILQFEKERGYNYPILKVGLLSLYSNFNEFQLTPSGFIARYKVTDFFNIIRYKDMSCEKQLDMLENDVMTILNNILTQKDLFFQMCECEKNEFGNILWDDSLKIAPSLTIRHLILIKPYISMSEML